MNLTAVFKQIIGKPELSVATITGDRGGGAWAAETVSGVVVTLNGQAEIGKKVFYDMRTHKIVGEAPNLAVKDVVV